jgi:hypothetical protein
MSFRGWQNPSENEPVLDKQQLSILVKGVENILAQNDSLKNTVDQYAIKFQKIEKALQELGTNFNELVKNTLTSRNGENQLTRGSSRKQVTVYFSKQFTIDALELLKEYSFLTELR